MGGTPPDSVRVVGLTACEKAVSTFPSAFPNRVEGAPPMLPPRVVGQRRHLPERVNFLSGESASSKGYIVFGAFGMTSENAILGSYGTTVFEGMSRLVPSL